MNLRSAIGCDFVAACSTSSEGEDLERLRQVARLPALLGKDA